MKISEIVAIAGYLANPKRLTHIEVEIPENMLKNYISDYEATTEDVRFPKSFGGDPVYVIPRGGDKWGREMRIYFLSKDDKSIPPELGKIATKSNRPGYEFYNQRVNNNTLIDHLIQYGFVLGSKQDEKRIKSRIPKRLVSEFLAGYILD